MDDEALIIGLYFYALEREREREKERVALCLVCTAHAFRTLWNSAICTVVWLFLLPLTSLWFWSSAMGPTCTISVVIRMRLDFESMYIFVWWGKGNLDGHPSSCTHVSLPQQQKRKKNLIMRCSSVKLKDFYFVLNRTLSCVESTTFMIWFLF